MKNTILLFIIAILLQSCRGCEQPSYIQGNSKQLSSTGADADYLAIRYIRDIRTGLCFAERGSTDDYSFTYVPCDSAVMKIINETKTCK